MARFIRKDKEIASGKLVRAPTVGPNADGMIGRITEFEVSRDEAAKEYHVMLVMTVTDANVAEAAGFAPTVFHGAKVGIIVLNEEESDLNPDVDEPVEEEEAGDPSDDEVDPPKIAEAEKHVMVPTPPEDYKMSEKEKKLIAAREALMRMEKKMSGDDFSARVLDA